MKPYDFRRGRVYADMATGLRHYLGANSITTLMCGATMLGSYSFVAVKEDVHATCVACVAWST